MSFVVSSVLFSIFFLITGLCKHIHVARHKATTPEEESRTFIANELHKAELYVVDWDYLHVYDGDVVSVLHRGTRRCHCIAASHKVDCICYILEGLLGSDTGTADTGTADETNQMSEPLDSPNTSDSPQTSDQLDRAAMDRALFFKELDVFRAQMEADDVLDTFIVQKARQVFSLKNQSFGTVARGVKSQRSTSSFSQRLSKTPTSSKRPLSSSSTNSPSTAKPKKQRKTSTFTNPSKNADGGPKKSKSRTRDKGTKWDDIVKKSKD